MSVRFLLQEATIRANHIHTTSTDGNYPVETAHEKIIIKNIKNRAIYEGTEKVELLMR